MNLPIVLIIGRPNVGKSTLFNYWAGHRLAIESDIAGTTRDYIECEIDFNGQRASLVDTAGLDQSTSDKLLSIAFDKTSELIKHSALILFVVAADDGCHSLDLQIAKFLRKYKKPIILIASKADNLARKSIAKADFWKLGLGEPLPFSVRQKIGLEELGHLTAEKLSAQELLPVVSKGSLRKKDKSDLMRKLEENAANSGQAEPESIRLALIGRPNVGKSSLTNKLIGEERTIVSDIPGTTRDLVEMNFSRDKQKFVLIDTAGMRRPGKHKNSLEFFSVDRTKKAIDHADVVGIVLDIHAGLAKLDLALASEVIHAGKSLFFIANKWDLLDEDEKIYMRKSLPPALLSFAQAPIVTVSALTGYKVDQILNTATIIYANRGLFIKTSLMNQLFADEHDILYIAQKSINPPLFSVSVRGSKIPHFSFHRRLENRIRKEFGFNGTPFKWVWHVKDNWTLAKEKLKIRDQKS